MPESSPQTLYALLVGIDHYLPNPWCESLHGAVADATAMESFLLTRGVPPGNLVKLTASPGPGGEPAEPPDRRPTHDLIVGAFRQLGRAASEVGGELVVHYSGHGCRTPTIIPATKGAEGLDEGLVPYDIADPEARILRDVELSYLLAEMGEVPVVLTLDACHSGGVLRGDLELRARGAETINRPPNGGIAPVEHLEASWRRSHQRTFASLEARDPPLVSRGADPWHRHLRPAVTFAAACRDREVAYEFPFEGEPRGALTYALLTALAEGDAAPSWERLERRVAHLIRRAGLHQTPVFEGEPSGALLGLLRQGANRALRVLDLDPVRKRVRLDAGRALGLARGARLEILASDKSGPRPAAVRVEIEESEASASWARLLQGDLAAVEPGDRAFVTDPGTGSRRRVLVVPPPGTGAVRGHHRAGATVREVFRGGSPRDEVSGNPARWFEDVERELMKDSSGFLEPVASPSSVAVTDFRITLDPRDRYEVLQPDGSPIPGLPSLPAASPGSARLLVDRLVHLARFYRVHDLKNGDARSPLHGGIRAELGRLPRGFTLGDDLDPEPCTELLPLFAAGEGVCLNVANRLPRTLHLYVLALGRGWSVRLLHPRQGLETLPAGQQVRLPFKLSLPLGSRGGLEIFKVLATTRPTNVRWLELPSISRATWVNRESRQPPTDPLETFLAAVLHGTTPMRGSAAHGASHAWITDQIALRLAAS